MDNLKVKNLCGNGLYEDEKLKDSFIKNDGYIILLDLIKEINEYANQVNAVYRYFRRMEKRRVLYQQYNL